MNSKTGNSTDLLETIANEMVDEVYSSILYHIDSGDVNALSSSPSQSESEWHSASEEYSTQPVPIIQKPIPEATQDEEVAPLPPTVHTQPNLELPVKPTKQEDEEDEASTQTVESPRQSEVQPPHLISTDHISENREDTMNDQEEVPSEEEITDEERQLQEEIARLESEITEEQHEEDEFDIDDNEQQETQEPMDVHHDMESTTQPDNNVTIETTLADDKQSADEQEEEKDGIETTNDVLPQEAHSSEPDTIEITPEQHHEQTILVEDSIQESIVAQEEDLTSERSETPDNSDTEEPPSIKIDEVHSNNMLSEQQVMVDSITAEEVHDHITSDDVHDQQEQEEAEFELYEEVEEEVDEDNIEPDHIEQPADDTIDESQHPLNTIEEAEPEHIELTVTESNDIMDVNRPVSEEETSEDDTDVNNNEESDSVENEPVSKLQVEAPRTQVTRSAAPLISITPTTRSTSTVTKKEPYLPRVAREATRSTVYERRIPSPPVVHVQPKEEEEEELEIENKVVQMARERLKMISKEEALRMKKLMELEKKRNEAMQLEIQAIERKKKEEEEEKQKQRHRLLELRRLKRLQDAKARKSKAEKLKKEEQEYSHDKVKPLYIKMEERFKIRSDQELASKSKSTHRSGDLDTSFKVSTHDLREAFTEVHNNKTKLAREKEEARAKLVKKAQYAALVREMFSPAIDPSKRNEVELRKQKKERPTGTSLSPSKPALPIAAIGTKSKKPMTDSPNKAQQIVQNLNGTLRSLKQKARDIEELTHKKENQLLEDAGYAKIEQRIEKHAMVSSMYIDAIKAKLDTYHQLTR